MFSKGWGNVFFLFVLFCLLFSTLSFSFALNDSDVVSGALVSDCGDGLDLEAYSAAKSTLRKCGGEAVQVSISRAVYNADQRGAYTTFHTLSSSTYVRKSEGGSLISGGQYLVEGVVGTTTKENIGKISKASWGELFSNRLCDFLKEKYLT